MPFESWRESGVAVASISQSGTTTSRNRSAHAQLACMQGASVRAIDAGTKITRGWRGREVRNMRMNYQALQARARVYLCTHGMCCPASRV